VFRPESVYAHLPIILQNIACSYHAWREARVRYGAHFRTVLGQLLESEHWSRADMDEYQEERLRALVRHVYENVPYYRDLMHDHRLRPDDVRSKSDLVKLPILTKEQVRRHQGRLIATTADRRRLRCGHTSGTTGKSLSFLTTPEAVAFQWAVWWRHRMRFGLGLRDWSVGFSGRPAVPIGQQRPPYWRWQWPVRRAYINMQHVTPSKVPDIVRFLNSRPFVYYGGYPSIIHSLASIALESGCELVSRPRVVTLGAENLHEFQRRDIALFTGALITDQYGFAEGCGNASKCEQGSYHEDSEYGILECVDPQPVENGNVRGRIVATGFACPEFPFIRYEVGDIGVWAPPSRSCACGRASTVLVRIEGRADEYVVTPEGHRVMRFGFVFKNTTNVVESQVVQHEAGAIVVRVVKRPEYGTADEDHIRGEIRRWISTALRVEFEYVDAIDREASGKFRAVRSLLKEGHLTNRANGGVPSS